MIPTHSLPFLKPIASKIAAHPLDHIARACGFLRRRSQKITPAGFLLTSCLFALQKRCSLTGFAQLWAMLHQQTLSKQAVHKRSGAAAVHFLKMNPLPWWWATEKFPLLAWARIQLADLLPSHVSRCIYLDTDTMVRRDLVELFDMPLLGNPIAMAINNSVPPEVLSYLHSIGIEPDRWFNSGVALIDVGAWRRNGVVDGLIHCKRAMPAVLWFPDQDLLNKYFAGRILKLDPSWNRRDVAYMPDGQIIHFAGPIKPWDEPDDRGYASLRAWRELYKLWGRTPAPKPTHRLKMRAASAVRQLITLARRVRPMSAIVQRTS